MTKEITVTTIQNMDLIADLFTEACTIVDGLGFYGNFSDNYKFMADELFYQQLTINGVKFNHDDLEIFKTEYPTSFITHTLTRYVNEINEFKASDIDIAVKALNNYEGNKVTILKYSAFGFPQTVHTVLSYAENKPYAQYNETLWITHKPKHSRKLQRTVITGSEKISIFEGWVNVDTNVGFEIFSENGASVKKSKYTSHDERFILDCINSTGKTPITSLNI